jgi:hypothetical protein
MRRSSTALQLVQPDDRPAAPASSRSAPAADSALLVAYSRAVVSAAERVTPQW